uniref:C2H2-type domain-containing protein n=1 Tax=Anas platyrhynchos platyrhynchos TaxID=8840 RepID=A0A493TIT0_ANAPP
MLWAVGSHPGMCRVAVPGWGTGLSPPRSSCWWPRPALGQRLAPGLPGGLPMLMSPGGLVAPAGTRGDTAGDTTGTPSSPADLAMPRSFLVKKKPPSTRGPNYGQLHARGEKPYACPHCGRAFADRSNLRAHLGTHSDTKRYRCRACARTFSRMALLARHQDGGCWGAS